MATEWTPAAILQELRTRRQRQWVMLAVALGGTFLAIGVGIAVGGHTGFGLVSAVSVALMLPFWIGMFWYTRRNWQCPACGAPLPSSSGNGYMWQVAACKQCHRALA